MSSGHCFPCIYEAPQKRLPAPTPQGRAEQFGRGHPGRVKARGGLECNKVKLIIFNDLKIRKIIVPNKILWRIPKIQNWWLDNYWTASIDLVLN